MVMRPATPEDFDGTRILLGFSSYAPRRDSRFIRAGNSKHAAVNPRNAEFPHMTYGVLPVSPWA